MPTSQDEYSTAFAPPEADLRLSPPPQHLPGPIGKRFVAALVDGIVCSVLSMPILLIMGIPIGFSNAGLDGGAYQAEAGLNIASKIVGLIIAFFYYGWFYNNKGATPGKMMMKLRVSHSETGANLSYGRAFLRETVGKFLSGVILMIGYLMAVFRDDKRALHDLIASTQVTYEP